MRHTQFRFSDVVTVNEVDTKNASAGQRFGGQAVAAISQGHWAEGDLPPVSSGPTGAGTLPDPLLDGLERAFRRLRRSIVKPPYTDVPVPSLGRPLAVAKVHACNAVHELNRSGAAVTVKDVATALRLQHSTVSRLVGELEADGLLVRDVDRTDRRRTTVALTATGQAVVRDSARMRRELIQAVLEGWSEADVAELAVLLTRLADSVAALPGLPGLPDLACAESLSDPVIPAQP